VYLKWDGKELKIMNLVNIRYDENGEGIFTLKSDDPKDTEYNRDYPRERLAKYVEKDY